MGNIDIKETKGGHYTLKVQDLGKLCNKENVASFFAKKSSSCEKCTKTCQTTDSIKNHNASNHAEQAACGKCEYTCHNMENLLAHTSSEHGELKSGSILKNSVKSDVSGNKKDEFCLHKAVTELNTQLNGKLTKKENKFAMIMKRIAHLQLQQVDGNSKCDVCEFE